MPALKTNGREPKKMRLDLTKKQLDIISAALTDAQDRASELAHDDPSLKLAARRRFEDIAEILGKIGRAASPKKEKKP